MSLTKHSLIFYPFFPNFRVSCRPQIRTQEITVPWRTVWSSRPQRRVRTALSLRPTQVSSSQPSCFETCAGPTSSLKSLPQTTMGKVSATAPKLWWVTSLRLFQIVRVDMDKYRGRIYCMLLGLQLSEAEEHWCMLSSFHSKSSLDISPFYFSPQIHVL